MRNRTLFLSPALALAALCTTSTLLSAQIEWRERKVDSNFDGAIAVEAADIDGDGDIDVIAAGSNADEIAWWENRDGSGTAWLERTVAESFDSAVATYAADLDGDDDLDILGASTFTAEGFVWWENAVGDGTLWTEHSVDEGLAAQLDIYATDMDNDGDLDVLGTSDREDHVVWWENTIGDGTTWTQHVVDADHDVAGVVHAGDLDGDGDRDIVVSAWDDTGKITWWKNTAGDGTVWDESAIDDDFTGASSVHTADLDDDGDLDVLASSFWLDAIRWWENTNGDGTVWSERTIGSSFEGPRDVQAADIDGDGDLDVLGAASTSIAWWENRSGGLFWVVQYLDTSFGGARSVQSGDINGDGDLDVLGAAIGVDDVSWWENSPLMAAQLTVTGPCPGKATIEVISAVSNANVVLLGSTSEGASQVPPGNDCSGLPLDLDSPNVLSTFVTGLDNTFTIERTLTEANCGLYLQALDRDACETTNVAPLSP